MEVIAIAFGLVLLWGYVAVAVYLARKVWALSLGKPEIARILLGSLVLALFCAPAATGVGHGVGVAPAWFVLLDPESNRFALKGASISLTATWAVLFAAGAITSRIRKHRKE
jgi:hypothetical protein